MELILGPAVNVAAADFEYRPVGRYDNASRFEVYYTGTGSGTSRDAGVLLGSVARLNVGRATWSATQDQGDEVALRWVGGFGDRHGAALYLLGGAAERDWPARAVHGRLHADVAALPTVGMEPHPGDAGPVWAEVGEAPWFGPLAAQDDDGCGTVFHRHFTAKLRDGAYAVLDVAFYTEALSLGTPDLSRLCVTRHTALRLCGDPHAVSETTLKWLRACVQNVPFVKDVSDDAAQRECEAFRPDLDVLVSEEISLVTRGYRRPGTAIRLGAPAVSLSG